MTEGSAGSLEDAGVRSRLFENIDSALRRIEAFEVKREADNERFGRALTAFEKHVDDCGASSKELTKQTQEILLGIQHLNDESTRRERADDKRDEDVGKMKEDITNLKNEAKANRDELDSLAEWRKFLIQRVLWWGIPLILTMLASSLSSHFIGG